MIIFTTNKKGLEIKSQALWFLLNLLDLKAYPKNGFA